MDKIFWEFGFQRVDFEFGKEHFQRMQAALGVHRIPRKYQVHIQHECTIFINWYAAEQINPSRKRINERLTDIDKKATKLCGILTELYKQEGSSQDIAERDVTRALIHMRGFAGRFKAPEEGRRPLDQERLTLAEHLSSLVSAARAAQRQLEALSRGPKTGKPREAALNECLMNLAELFESITRRKPGVTVHRYEQDGSKYGGNFVLFCEAFFDPVRSLPGFAQLSPAVTDRTKLGKRCERIVAEYKGHLKASP